MYPSHVLAAMVTPHDGRGTGWYLYGLRGWNRWQFNRYDYFFFLPFLPFAALYAFLAAEAAARPRLPIVRRFLYALTARLFFFAGFFAGMVYLKQIFK